MGGHGAAPHTLLHLIKLHPASGVSRSSSFHLELCFTEVCDYFLFMSRYMCYNQWKKSEKSYFYIFKCRINNYLNASQL